MSNSNISPTTGKSRSVEAYLFLTAAAMCWGANTIFGQLAIGESSPMMVVLGRWTGVLILCAIFFRGELRRDWSALKPHLPLLAVMGMLGFTGFNALFYVAAHYTSALNMGIVQGSTPVVVLIGVMILFKTPISPIQALGVLLTVVGVVTVGIGGDWNRLIAMVFNIGDILMVIASILYAGYIIGLRNRPAVSPFSLFTVMAGAAFLTSLPIAGIEAAMGLTQWPSLKGWAIIAGIALLPSFLAQLTFIQGVDRIGPARAGIFMNLIPIFAAVMAVTFLSEVFHTYHAIALSLVLVGIFLSEKFKSKRSTPGSR